MKVRKIILLIMLTIAIVFSNWSFRRFSGTDFLTNHGDLVNKILRAGNSHEKEYLVTVDKPITDEFIRGMGAGVPILGQKPRNGEKEAIMVFQYHLSTRSKPSNSSYVNILVMKSPSLNVSVL